MSTHGQDGDSAESVIKMLEEKLVYFRKEQACASSASEKFHLLKLIEDTENRIASLKKLGATSGKLGMEATDTALLDWYFGVCINHDPAFAPHLQGDFESRCQFLDSQALADRLPDGTIALKDQGILFCARSDLISRKYFHVHVHFFQGEGMSEVQEKLHGSVLFLYQELWTRLRPLTSRVMGNPAHRDKSGAEMAIHEYPPVAIVEALINFLIHRDYTKDDFGRIKVRSDRIEFTNPGRSEYSDEELMTSEEDLEPNYSRNQDIISAMNFAKLNQRMGSGVRRIREVFAVV